MNDIYEYPQQQDGTILRIGVVRCRFNTPIGEGLLGACLAELARLQVASNNIEVASVPGALEAPLVLQSMAVSGRFDALIVLGAVIRGETYHFELVSNESGAGVSRVALESGIPIANGILTTETEEQAQVRMQIKGQECAQAAVEMACLQQALAARGKPA